MARNWMLSIGPAHGGNLLPRPLPVSLVDRCVELGHPKPGRGEDVKIRKAVARAYRQAHGGEEPHKHTQFVDGRPVQVNSYTTADMPVIDRGICEYYGNKAQ